MPSARSIRLDRSRGSPGEDRSFALVWHLAGATVVAASAAFMVWRGMLGEGPALLALSLVVATALAGALLAALGSRPADAVAILAWAVTGATTAQMTGGTAGPLAVWCLAPLAAAASFRRPALLSFGAAAGLAACAIAALSAALVNLPHPSAELSTWLSLLALGTTGLGFAGGLVAFQGRVRGDAAHAAHTVASLQATLEQQPLLLMALAPDGRILKAYGEPPAGVELRIWLRQTLADLVAPEEREVIAAALAQATVEGAAEIGFTPLNDPEGWCMLAVRRTDRGGLTAALRDARAQRDRERALVLACVAAEEQNAGKSRFLANMSHELRTPLNAIMGFSDIMRQRLFGPMSDRYSEYAELIHESGAHLLELINDVLDMSKIEAEKFELAREDFDARDAFAAVLRLMRGQAERAGISLRSTLPNDPLEADADRRALKQIALNLLSNALKFTPKGGVVTLAAKADGEWLEIRVADTGVGISSTDLERLGRPFEQAGDADQRQGGAGLGLSLVRAFARLHGGEMTMQSRVGEGTTVTVRMPVLVPGGAIESQVTPQAVSSGRPPG